MKYTDPVLLDELAAHYVLGTLRGRARQRFERLARERADVAALVFAWERRLAQLDPPPSDAELPPQRVWQGVLRSPWPRRSRQGDAYGDATLGKGADKTPTVGSTRRWRGRDHPRGGTWIVAEQQQPAPAIREVSPAYVSVIADSGGTPVWSVQIYADPPQLRVRVTQAPAPLTEQQVYQLWMLPTDAAPVSLGLLPRFGTVRTALTPAALEALAGSSQLAVSTEPPGGSPTGQPTGDVVFIAPLASG